MKIKTLGNRIQLTIDKPKAGNINTDSLKVAHEVARVAGIGDDVTLPLKVGDKVLVKAWAIDIISADGETYYFVSQSTNGICAVLR